MVNTSKSLVLLALLALTQGAFADGVYTRTVARGTTSNSSGGATSPASPGFSVQFNNAGAFGGDAGLLYFPTSDSLVGTYISASSGLYTSNTLNGAALVSLTGYQFINKQTTTSSVRAIVSESPNGVSNRVYADSSCAQINRNGSAAMQLSICAAGFGFGTASVSEMNDASATVIGSISTTAINLSSPTSVPTCNVGHSGYTFYNNTTKCMNYCDGTAYRQVTSLAASCS